MYHDDEGASSEESRSVVDGHGTLSSSATSLSREHETPEEKLPEAESPVLVSELADLYGEHVAAKIWRVAESYLDREPNLETYPEYVPATGNGEGTYQPKPAPFWTCGFFPASLYCLLERSARYPQTLPRPAAAAHFHAQLLGLCRRWSTPLLANAGRTNTHDLGFIMRSLRMDWELTGNAKSLASYVTAAESLASRFDERVGAIRSWDKAVSHSYEIVDREKNFLVIIDSLLNLDLLFYAAHQSSNPRLSAIATAHAHVVSRTLIRPDNSTWHVVNLDPRRGGVVQFRMTHQGYADDSTWARGQAWGILGFAQTYSWTGDSAFLDAAERLADHFLTRLEASLPSSLSPTWTHRYVPRWDFDAPINEDLDTEGQPLRDTSAGMIAANGLLLLHQSLQGLGQGGRRYLDAALRIARDTLGYSLDRDDAASFTVGGDGMVQVAPGTWDAILKHSTANNNRNALVRYRDHGLVYADYYFLEFGNKLLRMGLV